MLRPFGRPIGILHRGAHHVALRGDCLRGQLMSPLSLLIKQSFESPFCSDSAETPRSPTASRLAPATTGFAPGSAPRAAVHYSSPLQQSTTAVNYSSPLQQSVFSAFPLCFSSPFLVISLVFRAYRRTRVSVSDAALRAAHHLAKGFRGDRLRWPIDELVLSRCVRVLANVSQLIWQVNLLQQVHVTHL